MITSNNTVQFAEGDSTRVIPVKITSEDNATPVYVSSGDQSRIQRVQSSQSDRAQKVSLINVGSPAAWFQFNVGITETGQGVSQWDDKSGNGRHLKQATDGARPAKQADGSILFNGSDEFMKCDAFTLNQPTTVYFLGKQVTWTSTLRLWDGNTINTMGCIQQTTTPRIRIAAGAAVDNNDFAVDTYAVVSAVYNGASSVLQVNNGTAVTGDAGASNAGGFTLGANGSNLGFSNIEVKEVILFAAAHNAAQRAGIVAYLAAKGGVTL